MDNLSFPVQIDSIMQSGEFQRTRCIYFRVEVAEGLLPGPHPVSHEDEPLIVAWGSWAVLAGPGKALDAQGLFVSSELINQTFQRIEETKGQFLDLGYIWLPNELLNLQDRDKKIRNGDVYRLSTPLFRQCYLFVAGMIAEGEWLELCKSTSAAVWPSPEETKAFRKWRQDQIERSRSRYHHHDYADRRLKKKGTKE